MLRDAKPCILRLCLVGKPVLHIRDFRRNNNVEFVGKRCLLCDGDYPLVASGATKGGAQCLLGWEDHTREHEVRLGEHPTSALYGDSITSRKAHKCHCPQAPVLPGAVTRCLHCPHSSFTAAHSHFPRIMGIAWEYVTEVRLPTKE